MSWWPNNDNIKTVKEKLKQLFSQIDKRRIVNPKCVSAAVLVPVYERDGQYHILFIKRTEWVEKHKGEISFPGGVYEEHDVNLLNTALRESFEEINLKPDDVEVLGELDDVVSAKTNYRITPFLAFIPWPYEFKVDGHETEEIIEAPIPTLMNIGRSRQELRGSETFTVYRYNYKGRVIWGATARILAQFLDIFARAERS
ncbi:MAG: CoA pyrophosphatase [Dehalococcoidales bacterium]